jgi:multisubunit Na+/H+ antiporter MnhG subunit
MARQVAVDVLLGLAVLITAVSSVGVLVMRDAFQKLHYVTPVSVVAPALVALAVLVSSSASNRSAVAWLTVLFLVLASACLSHATMRAARIRIQGDWRGRPADRGDPPAGADKADGPGR